MCQDLCSMLYRDYLILAENCTYMENTFTKEALIK
uniref:Uncharacterized protein n=1 Tax=Trichinella nativa TaxID=6335 RepID=A0A0V1KI64_9BILA